MEKTNAKKVKTILTITISGIIKATDSPGYFQAIECVQGESMVELLSKLNLIVAVMSKDMTEYYQKIEIKYDDDIPF